MNKKISEKLIRVVKRVSENSISSISVFFTYQPKLIKKEKINDKK